MFALILDPQLQFVTKSTGKIQIPVRIFIDFLRARLNRHEMHCGRRRRASNPAYQFDPGNFWARRFARIYPLLLTLAFDGFSLRLPPVSLVKRGAGLSWQMPSLRSSLSSVPLMADTAPC
ncbi:hypothetical protein VOM14_14780 [Paraburkholderia sp. MPAMCS5]|uniref:hypothetical protein n=1 Tax=Paraburkholderia sp. MPAMCS5 TaxID=3112563 RepID=UPI002E189BFD|nr:hypothetical protein [Paraburkholderia sp. MPAMCS5]